MDSRLEKLSSLCGIEPGYHDVFGNWQPAGEQAHRAILAAMDIDASSPAAVEGALAARERERWLRVVPPVTVLRSGRIREGARLYLPQPSLMRTLSWRIAEEDGRLREGRFDAAAREYTLALPEDLPHGYHRLAVLDDGAVLGEGALVIAPDRCYLPPAIAEGARVWGAAVQLYGVRSEHNAGIGDFTDLRHVAETWGERGGAIVGVSPLHALSLRDPGHASPYSPSSRLFLNVLYIDVDAVEDFAELCETDESLAPRWKREKARLREAAEVDYVRVAAAKRAMFETLHAHFAQTHGAHSTRRARAFADFRGARGAALRRHALHDALADFHGLPWRQWPEEHRDPESEAVRLFAQEHAGRVGLHEYLQWQADLQLGEAQSRANEVGMSVGLYTDLAISIGADGSEAWANQKLYAFGVSVGAPPDEFNPQGQDWGLPPLSPQRLREHAYAPLIATLRANMARAGALRIDHVMGLARLYWVPHGMPAAQGAYVRYPLDEMLGIVALESHRNRCLVIGEDLGTVPDDLRRRLADVDILSYRLLLFEREGRAFKAPPAYPRKALVTWSTHDLPTLEGWLQGEDLRTRAELGLAGEKDLRTQREERADARAALEEALGTSEDLPLAVHAFLAKTPSAVLVVQMEDVLGVRDQANLPGTITEHPNWRRKLPLPIEAWPSDAGFKRLTERLAKLRGR